MEIKGDAPGSRRRNPKLKLGNSERPVIKIFTVMNTKIFLLRLGATTGLFTASASAQTIWEAFNDHRGGASTDPNTTVWEMRSTGSGGALKNIVTGADLLATLMVEEEG